MNLLNQIVMESYTAPDDCSAAFESLMAETEDFSEFDSAMEAADGDKAGFIAKIGKAFKDTITKVLNFIKSIAARVKRAFATMSAKRTDKKLGKVLGNVTPDNCPLKGVDADDVKFICETANVSHDASYVTTNDLLNATNALKKAFEGQINSLKSADPTKKEEFNKVLSEVKTTNTRLKKLTTICANVDKMKDPAKLEEVMQKDIDSARAERDEANRKYTDASNTRDAYKKQMDSDREYIGKLSSDRDLKEKERDTARNERDEALAGKKKAETERDYASHAKMAGRT